MLLLVPPLRLPKARQSEENSHEYPPPTFEPQEGYLYILWENTSWEYVLLGVYEDPNDAFNRVYCHYEDIRWVYGNAIPNVFYPDSPLNIAWILEEIPSHRVRFLHNDLFLALLYTNYPQCPTLNALQMS